MKLDLKNKVEHALLGRTEVTGTVTFDQSTPARNDVRKELATQLKADESLVLVTAIDGSFGQRKAQFSAQVYANKESFDTISGVTARARHLSKEERKALKEKKAKK